MIKDMGSMHWTDEESRYLKAIFSWQDRLDNEPARDSRAGASGAKACVSEFRVLIIGAKGVGKTALLTKFCDGTFRGEGAPPDPRFVRGGRRTVAIDNLLYNMDVLEMPSQHLAADGEAADGLGEPLSSTATSAAMMLEQALAITEAAIVVYDVCNPASFLQARRLYERLQRERGPAQQHQKQQQLGAGRKKSMVAKQKSMRFRRQQQKLQSNSTTRSVSSAAAKKPPRPFALLLVGNKNDADDGDRGVPWVDGSKAAAAPAAASSSAAAPTAATFFLEASAKTGDNVTDVFVRIGQEILRQREQQKQDQQWLQDQLARDEGGSSAASSTTTNNSLLRMKSQASSSTTRRTLGALRVLGFSFMRRAAVLDKPIVT